MELRDFQKQILEKISLNLYFDIKKMVVVAPTGAGKTFIAANLLKSFFDEGKNCLFLVDRRKLVRQSAEEISRFTSCGIIMSGEPITQHKVQICSSQSFNLWVMKNGMSIPDPDLIIFDECHVRTKFQEEVMKVYTNCIYIGLTATPCNKSGFGLGNLYNDLIQVTSYAALINQKQLVPSIFYAPSQPNLKGVKIKQGDYDQEEAGTRMKVLSGDIVEHWLKLGANRKTLAFCSSISQSRGLIELFKQAGIPCEHTDCYMPEEERAVILERLRIGELKLVSNVALYSYGFNEPLIDCILLARPTKSYVLYLQIVGRGMRTANGKSDLLVLDHTGSVYRHGMPEDAGDWELISHEKINKPTAAVKEKIKKLHTCVKCKEIFVGSQCSQGHKIGKMSEKPLQNSDKLVSYKKGIIITEDEKQLWYQQFKGYQVTKNKSDKWLLATYKSKFNEWPQWDWRYLNPIQPGGRVLSWVIHQKIKWLHTKGKYNEAPKN